jgi:hypothetical protein
MQVMARFLLALLLVSTLALVPAQTVAAQAEAGCQPGQVPRFVFGFADLKAQVGDAMGDPQTCEFPDPNGTGDVHQRTTTGLAFWRKSTNTPTFTNGFEHWAQTSGGWVTWTGASIDPPNQANAYPEVVVDAFLSSCDGPNPDGQRRSTCQCAIDRIQARYSLADFVDLAQRTLAEGALPGELTPIVLECIQ